METNMLKAIKREHIKLDPAERANVIEALSIAMLLYEHEVLSRPAIRQFIYDLYNQRVKAGKATSVLSSKFNMAHKGHNERITKEIDEHIHNAFQYDQSGDVIKALEELKKIQFRHFILFDERVQKLCKDNVEIALSADSISALQDKLYRSTINMITYIAKQSYNNLTGTVIEFDDVLQEALLAARRAIKAYQPIEEGRTFTSYMTRFVRGLVSNYLAENTRTVSLPRTIIDRYRPVKEATDILGHTHPETVAKLATKILSDKRKLSRQANIQKDEVYTAEEVHSLIQQTQEIASLDAEVITDEYGGAASLADVLEDKLPAQDILYDAVHNIDALMSVIKDYCNKEEYHIMEIRWGGMDRPGRSHAGLVRPVDAVRGLKTTADIYRKNTGKSMNKGKVREIERHVFNRLLKGVSKGDKRLQQIKETVESL